MKEKSGSRTMLLSVLMSAPGPLVMGLGLLAGRSAAQVADFVRRSAELMALIVAYIVYLRTAEMPDEQQKAKLERGSNLFVGLSMCAGGLIMLLIALFAPNTREGSVIGGLIIAALGMGIAVFFAGTFLQAHLPQTIATLGSVAVGVVVYAALAVVLRVFNAEDLTLIPGGARLRRVFDRKGR